MSEEKHLFMMCDALNQKALTPIPEGYHVRFCREDELGIWKAMMFNSAEAAKENDGFMTDYFNQVYGKKGDLFFQTCVFICNGEDKPVGTCFLWKAYDEIWAVHWYKVKREYEGKGLGRALLSYVMKSLPQNEYPVFLHTHPESFRAIKLYSDFGFKLLTDEKIGKRPNDLQQCLPLLKETMHPADFEKLQFAEAPKHFLETVHEFEVVQAFEVEEF